MDEDKFNQFWSEFFARYGGKREVKDGFIQFSVVDYPYEPHPLTRLHIECQHDPAIDPRGVQEKKDAMRFLQGYIEHYTSHVLHQ